MHRLDATGREDHTPVGRVRWTTIAAIRSSRPITRYVAALAAIVTIGIGITTDVRIATAVTLVALIPAVLVDVLDRRLPDRLVAGAAATWLGIAAITAVTGHGVDVIGAALGIAALAGPLLTLHVVSPPSLGFGDVKAGAVIGMALGLTDPLLALFALCIGSAASATVTIARSERAIAFGPGLLGGAMAASVLFVSPAYGPGDSAEVIHQTHTIPGGVVTA